MGKVMQIDEHAPAVVREALDKQELSINQGYNITKQVQDLPEEQREEAAIQAVELAKAKRKFGNWTPKQTAGERLPGYSVKLSSGPYC